MNLSAPDAAEFLALYSAVLHYANQQLRVLPGVTTRAALEKRPVEDTARIRDALYDHPELIEAFVAENPEQLGADELALVASWKRFVRGDFYLVRYLKRYAVFLDSVSPARAYGVLGLSHPIQDLVPPQGLPVYLKTVLLPFKGRIIYDGIAHSYAVSFGPGIRGSLNETYRAIRENEGVVESLEPAADDGGARAPVGRAGELAKRRRPVDEWLAVLDRMQQDAEHLRGTTTPLESRAFSMLRAAVLLARAAVAEPEDTAALARLLRRTSTALTQLENTLHRACWRE
jgi:hypothetical protein